MAGDHRGNPVAAMEGRAGPDCSGPFRLISVLQICVLKLGFQYVGKLPTSRVPTSRAVAGGITRACAPAREEEVRPPHSRSALVRNEASRIDLWVIFPHSALASNACGRGAKAPYPAYRASEDRSPPRMVLERQPYKKLEQAPPTRAHPRLPRPVLVYRKRQTGRIIAGFQTTSSGAISKVGETRRFPGIAGG